MKKFLCLVLACVLMMGMASSALAITLTYGHTDTEDSVTGRQAQLFADKVNEYTEGRVKINVYPLAQLGSSAEMVTGVQLGMVDMTFLTMAMLGSMMDEFNALDTPYLFESAEECIRVTDPSSPVMQYLIEKLYNETGVKYLYSFYFGTRQTTCNSPIYKPADMKGRVFRSLAFEFYASYIDSLGAVATQIDISELPQALQAGSVEGQENPLDVIITRQMYEYQKYLILTNHMICSQGVVINGFTWDSIPAEDQALIMKAAEETVMESNAYATGRTDELLQLLVDKGMTVIDESNGLELDAFRTQVNTYIQNKYGERYAKVYELIEESKKVAE